MYTQILQRKIIHSIITTLTQLRHTQIYKNIFTQLGVILLLCNTGCAVNAVEFGAVKYNDKFIDYSKIDKASTLSKADYYFEKALKAKNADEKKDFLQKASGEYFILSQINPESLYPIVQLARVYDMENQNSYSKAYFFKALKIDKKNAATNYYFGEYYFVRDDYKRALYFYNTAFENGYRENFDVLLKMATMYEKLGDLLRANQYYKKAFLVNPTDTKIPDKIRELEKLNYKKTGYYNKRRKQ